MGANADFQDSSNVKGSSLLRNLCCRGNQLDLEHPRGANALMVKLIDSENLMDASDELDGSIDITFVRCWGKYLEVTVDKIVGAPPQAHVDVGRAEYFADGHWMYK